MTASKDVYIKNKKAYFEYFISDKYTAGIKLLGTEIKSIREGKANVNDAFCTFIDGQLYVRNLAEKLQAEGLDVRPILSPTVAAGTERLRISLHAFNTAAEIAQLTGIINTFTL